MTGGWQWLVVGGWCRWRLAIGGGWWLAVGGPLVKSLRTVLKKKKIQFPKDPPGVDDAGWGGPVHGHSVDSKGSNK